MDGFVVLSGPDCSGPDAGDSFVYVQEMPGTSDLLVASSVPYANLWEGTNHEGTGFPYTFAIAAYWDNNKALDFLQYTVKEIVYDPS